VNNEMEMIWKWSAPNLRQSWSYMVGMG